MHKLTVVVGDFHYQFDTFFQNIETGIDTAIDIDRDRQKHGHRHRRRHRHR